MSRRPHDPFAPAGAAEKPLVGETGEDPTQGPRSPQESVTASSVALAEVPDAAADVVDWIGRDVDRALAALAAERERPASRRRSSVVDAAEAVLGGR